MNVKDHSLITTVAVVVLSVIVVARVPISGAKIMAAGLALVMVTTEVAIFSRPPWLVQVVFAAGIIVFGWGMARLLTVDQPAWRHYSLRSIFQRGAPPSRRPSDTVPRRRGILMGVVLLACAVIGYLMGVVSPFAAAVLFLFGLEILLAAAVYLTRS